MKRVTIDAFLGGFIIDERDPLVRAASNNYCPWCAGWQGYHPFPWGCPITPEEWKRGKAAQRTGIAIALIRRRS